MWAIVLVHFKSGIPNINEDAVYKLADFGSAFYWRYTNVKAETYGGTEEFWAPVISPILIHFGYYMLLKS